MQRLNGIAVSPGVAIGEALVIDHEGFRIPRRFVARDAVDSELQRFDGAVQTAAEEIGRNRDEVSRQLGKEYGAIFSAHLQMLRDPRLRREVEEMIRERHYSPEYAVSRVLRRYTKVFESLEHNYLADKAHDIADIEKRLLRHLLGADREALSNLTSPVLILAHMLTPSETAGLDRSFVKGFVTETGGPGSHTAIVACALEIPAVVGMGPFLSEVSGGDTIIIDGNRGEVILQPDAETLARYQREAEQARSYSAGLEHLRELPAQTIDGTRIELMGNIEFPEEVTHCLERGCDGIGLYRTEFLYMGGDAIPDEETHYQAYARVVEQLGDKPVVIRTLDLGADKVLGPDVALHERNPFLGLRSIRISLRNLPLFRTQLRAIMRASVLGNVRFMFPLISTLVELRQAKMVLADVLEDLEENGIPFNRDAAIGMMIEVPAAVIMIDRFVEEIDFVSIGTNDLIQYTLAVDRDNKEVASLYNASDPSVLKLIETTVHAARRHHVPVNVCGQMSSSPTYTMLLLGMGLRQLSVTPAAIPEIKKVCRSVTIEQCESVYSHAIRLENARDIKNYLKEELKKFVPDVGSS